VEERAKSAVQGTEGDKALKLESPLRPSLWRIRFSPNGKYVLAQDEGGVAIVDREEKKLLFRIDAPDAEEAQFSLDSERVVLHDSQLRVEQWSVAKQERISVKEVVLYEGCEQTLLSPDAKTIVCASLNVGTESVHVRIRMVDVESGQVLYDKPKFVELRSFLLLLDLANPSNLGNMLISPDGRYALFVAADHALAYDLERREPVQLGGKLKNLGAGRMAFQDANLLYLVGSPNSKGTEVAQTLSFPDGRVVKESAFRGQWVFSTTKGQRLLVGPLKDYAVGVWNPDDNKIVAVSRTNSIDAWGQVVAWESTKGNLALQELPQPQLTEVLLPLGSLPPPRLRSFQQTANIWRSRSAIALRSGIWIQASRRLWFVPSAAHGSMQATSCMGNFRNSWTRSQWKSN